MKQMRGLLVAAIALAVLSGLAYWSRKHKADEAKQPAPDAPPKILTLDSVQIDEVRLQKSGAEPVVLTKLGDRWEITKPLTTPADQEAVSALVTTASSLISDQLVDDKPGSLAPFGLDAPATQITLHLKTGKSSTLQFGKDVPAGGSTYVKLAADARVFTLSSFSKSSLDKSLNDLRDKRLLTFNSDKLSRVDLNNKSGALEFGKNGQNEWQILKPEPMRADGLQVEDLVRKLKEAKIQLDAGKIPDAKFAAAQKLASVTLTDNAGDQTAEIRQDKEKNTYAKSSVTDGIYQIGADVADVVAKPANDFRNRKLFDFGFSELSQVTVPNAAYVRGGEKWFLNGKEMDGSSVLSLIDKLRDFSATGFAPKASGTPIFEVSITTQDKKRMERVTILRGATGTLARRDGEPAIYTLDNAVVDDLMKIAADIKPAAPAKTPAKK